MGAPFSTALKRCSRCLLPETHETILIDGDGVCNVCRAQEVKDEINWPDQLQKLDALVEEYRGRYRYDCLVPFSGGKDSIFPLPDDIGRAPALDMVCSTRGRAQSSSCGARETEVLM